VPSVMVSLSLGIWISGMAWRLKSYQLTSLQRELTIAAFVSLQPLTDFFHRSDDLFRARQDCFFQRLVVMHSHFFLRNAHDRSIELVEDFFLNAKADFGADSAKWAVLLCNHHSMSLAHGFENRWQIQRLDRTQIEHLGVDPILRQLLRRDQRHRHRLRITNDGNVASLLLDLGFA